jgi:hypothetical protein
LAFWYENISSGNPVPPHARGFIFFGAIDVFSKIGFGLVETKKNPENLVENRLNFGRKFGRNLLEIRSKFARNGGRGEI